MPSKIKSYIFITIACGIFFIVNSSLAATCAQKYTGYGQCASDCTSLGTDFQKDTSNDQALCDDPTLFCCYKTGGSAADNDSILQNLQLQVPIFDKANISSLPEYIATVYRYLLIILVPLAIIMVIIGGVSWIAAAGDSGKIQNAKKYITSAFAGLIIGLFSYVLLSLVGITSLNMPGIQKIAPEVGDMLVLADGTIVSYSEYMSKLPPERRGSIAEYDAKGCPKGQTTFQVLFTNYYMPKYGETYGGNDFFCNVGMQCTCPNGDARDTSKNCNFKRVYHPCSNFSADTPYCTNTASGKAPKANYTVAADSSCFQLKSGCQFTIQGSANTYEIQDTGGWIHGQHMDLFVGYRENINNIAGVYTVTLQNPGSCFK